MAVLNSVISFNPTVVSKLQANCRKTSIRSFLLEVPSGPVALRQHRQRKQSRFYLLAASGDNVVTEATDKDSESIEASQSDDGPSNNVPNVNPSAIEAKDQSSDESSLKPSSTMKRAPLTARERLRAARVLSRYTEPKRSKPELGSKLLEALKETDKGKRRPGLPEAPTNMFDDSKRGLPKQGWTINISAGMDVFLVIFSFVFISTVMFATTFIVWKVGAIHFNEN